MPGHIRGEQFGRRQHVVGLPHSRQDLVGVGLNLTPQSPRDGVEVGIVDEQITPVHRIVEFVDDRDPQAPRLRQDSPQLQARPVAGRPPAQSQLQPGDRLGGSDSDAAHAGTPSSARASSFCWTR